MPEPKKYPRLVLRKEPDQDGLVWCLREVYAQWEPISVSTVRSRRRHYKGACDYAGELLDRHHRSTRSTQMAIEAAS